MKLLDEHGTRWVVMAHDPASTFVNALKRRGFDFVVLKRDNYKTGLLSKEPPERGSVDYLLWVRLYDCWNVLSGNPQWQQ